MEQIYKKEKHMKKVLSLILAAVMMMSLLAACGKANKEVDVDLVEFYNTLEEKYDWGGGFMVDIEGEILENYYPGLDAIEKEQFIAKTPIVGSVNEVVFVKCKNKDDVAKVAEIMQGRIDAQADGGAWYPAACEAWGRGKVITNGRYVAMIACIEFQEEVEAAFNACFNK